MKRLAASSTILLCLIVLALSPSVVAQQKQVTNVEELYSAVNDPANAGATLVLSPGTYSLSANDPNSLPRPNGGRIELQPDMSLTGVEGDRSAVVISALNLPATSFPTTANGAATGPNAAVRMGLGHNSLEWLTVRDAKSGQANIDAGLQPLDPGTAYVRVAHVASTGSARGINIANFGPKTSGQTIEAEIFDNYFFGNLLGVSEGIRIGNFQGAVGSTVNVRMAHNLLWGQLQGRSMENNAATTSTLNVESFENGFYGNGVGTIVAGGLTAGTPRADGNTINLYARGDEFIGNTYPGALDQGGLFVVGSENVSAAGGGGSNNTVNVRLRECRMIGNTSSDLSVIGARTGTPATDASLNQDNQVTIDIDGDHDRDHDNDHDHDSHGSWRPVQVFADSLPASPDYGNSVTVTH